MEREGTNKVVKRYELVRLNKIYRLSYELIPYLLLKKGFKGRHRQTNKQKNKKEIQLIRPNFWVFIWDQGRQQYNTIERGPFS